MRRRGGDCLWPSLSASCEKGHSAWDYERLWKLVGLTRGMGWRHRRESVPASLSSLHSAVVHVRTPASDVSHAEQFICTVLCVRISLSFRSRSRSPQPRPSFAHPGPVISPSIDRVPTHDDAPPGAAAAPLPSRLSSSGRRCASRHEGPRPQCMYFVHEWSRRRRRRRRRSSRAVKRWLAGGRALAPWPGPRFWTASAASGATIILRTRITVVAAHRDKTDVLCVRVIVAAYLARQGAVGQMLR